jgi:hypothetical protein
MKAKKQKAPRSAGLVAAARPAEQVGGAGLGGLEETRSQTA